LNLAKNVSRRPVNSAPYSIAPGEDGSVPPGLLAAAERSRRFRETAPPAGRRAGDGRKGSRRTDGGGGPANRSLLTGVLGAVAAGLFLVIAAGTLYTLIKNPGAFSGPSSSAGRADSFADSFADSSAEGSAGSTGGGLAAGPQAGRPAGEEEAAAGNTIGNPAFPVPETAMFTGIGRLRMAVGSAAVVLSVVFPYPSADRPFVEELAGKVPRFRQIIRDYFGSLSPDEPDSLNEQRAKAELLRHFNDELRLGSIELLLFDDFLVLE
jgi:flagellar basal body-associated protein FliL